MTLKKLLFHRHNFLILLLLIFVANITLYYTAFGISILSESPNGVIIGSMIDLVIVMPLLFIAWRRHWNVKHIILTIAGGLVLARFMIPMKYLEPFATITWIGFAVEGIIILFEISLVFLLVKYLPVITRHVKNSSLPTVFSFSDAVDRQFKKIPSFIKVICSEMLIFYYAFGSWRKQPEVRANTFTLHKNSSMFAVNIMLVHSVLIETIAIHWWLHSKFFIVSMILLILNIYTVIFLIGNMQAVRFNALHITDKNLYISFGLLKRMKISWLDIEHVIDSPEELNKKLSKDTIDFIARDLDSAVPHVILKLKQPVKAALIFGFEKKFQSVAIRLDEPEKFKTVINEMIRSKSHSKKRQ